MTVATMTDAPKAIELAPTAKERDFALAQREATALANSSLVPESFRGNVANCLIAMNLARRTGFDALMVMQSLSIIHGRPSFSATFLIACVNACGRFTPLRYRITGKGDSLECVAYATDKETGEEIEGPPVSMAMAKAEGWVSKNGSKWKTMPELMIRYRAAAFFARTIAPEISMGMMTAEELDDVRGARRTGTATSASEALSAAKDITPPKVEPPTEDESQDVDESLDLFDQRQDDDQF